MRDLEKLYRGFFETYPIYRKYESIALFQELHNWLWKPETIAKMIDAIKFERPAIEGVVTDIEMDFWGDDLYYDDDFLKKAVGTLIKYVLGHFGYVSSRQKNISKGKEAKWFTSGMHYEFDSKQERMRLVTTISILDLNASENE